MRRQLFKTPLYAIIPSVAALLTWLSGSLVSWYGGYPVSWRIIFCTEAPAPYSTCGSYYDWTIFTFDVLFLTAIGYSLLLGYALFELQRRAPQPTVSRAPISGRPLLMILLCYIIPGMAALAAWLTGSVFNVYGGFPLNWRMPCYVQAPTTIPTPATGGSCGIYDWVAFDLDVLVYTMIGYSLLTFYFVYDSKRQAPTALPKPQASFSKG